MGLLFLEAHQFPVDPLFLGVLLFLEARWFLEVQQYQVGPQYLEVLLFPVAP